MEYIRSDTYVGVGSETTNGHINMGTNPPTFEMRTQDKPTGYSRMFKNFTQSMWKLLSGSGGVVWVNNLDDCITPGYHQDTTTMLPYQNCQYYSPVNDNCVYSSKDNSSYYYYDQSLSPQPSLYSNMPYQNYDMYDSSMIKKPCKPLNPEAEEYIPLNSQNKKSLCNDGGILDTKIKSSLSPSSNVEKVSEIISSTSQQNSGNMNSECKVVNDDILTDYTDLSVDFITENLSEENFVPKITSETYEEIGNTTCQSIDSEHSFVSASSEIEDILEEESSPILNEKGNCDEDYIDLSCSVESENIYINLNGDADCNDEITLNISEDDESSVSDDEFDIVFGQPDDTTDVLDFENILEHESSVLSNSSCDSLVDFERLDDSVQFAESEDETSKGNTLSEKPSNNKLCNSSASILFTSKTCISAFSFGCDDDSDDEDSDSDDDSSTCCDINVDDSWEFSGLLACRLTSTYLVTTSDEVDHYTDSMSERKNFLKRLNDTWNKSVEEDIKASTPRKVSFDDNPTVRVMRTWAFAHRMARKGIWEMYARDRDRFKKRIDDLAPIISTVLDSTHRERVYKSYESR